MLALLLLNLLVSDKGLIDAVGVDDRWIIDIEYATTDNFTGKVLYPTARCLLLATAMNKLQKAQAWLDEKHSGYVFMLKDCYRPVAVQRIMWEAVVGTKMQSYVANPNTRTGSIHNYGAAVDLTLARDGKEVDMGTPYDFFGKLAEPRHEDRFLETGELSVEQVTRRRILRDAMLAAGYSAIKNEWWHFNALPIREVRKKFEKLDLPLDAASGIGKKP